MWTQIRILHVEQSDEGLHYLAFSKGFHNTRPGPGCSKLTTSLVNVSLKFQTLISQICQYFLLKKCEKLLQCKSFSHFFNKKISVYIVFGYSRKTLNELTF